MIPRIPIASFQPQPDRLTKMLTSRTTPSTSQYKPRSWTMTAVVAAGAARTAVIVQLLGLYWLVDGVVRLVSIFVNRSGWGWKLAMGILGIILGLAVLQHPLWSTLLI